MMLANWFFSKATAHALIKKSLIIGSMALTPFFSSAFLAISSIQESDIVMNIRLMVKRIFSVDYCNLWQVAKHVLSISHLAILDKIC